MIEFTETTPAGRVQSWKADTVADLVDLMRLFPPDRPPSMATVDLVVINAEKRDAKRRDEQHGSAGEAGQGAAGEGGPGYAAGGWLGGSGGGKRPGA